MPRRKSSGRGGGLAALVEAALAAGTATEVRVNAAALGGVPAPPADCPEREFQAAVLALAGAGGWRAAHFRPARVRRDGEWKYETPVAADGKGWPDLVLARPPRLLALELKAGRNRPTAEQRAWIDLLSRCGVEAFVFYPGDWESVRGLLE